MGQKLGHRSSPGDTSQQILVGRRERERERERVTATDHHPGDTSQHTLVGMRERERERERERCEGDRVTVTATEGEG